MIDINVYEMLLYQSFDMEIFCIFSYDSAHIVQKTRKLQDKGDALPWAP